MTAIFRFAKKKTFKTQNFITIIQILSQSEFISQHYILIDFFLYWILVSVFNSKTIQNWESQFITEMKNQSTGNICYCSSICCIACFNVRSFVKETSALFCCCPLYICLNRKNKNETRVISGKNIQFSRWTLYPH